MRIDAHQHFWRFRPEEYGWIDDSMDALRRDFVPAELAPLMRSQKVDATIAVQARQTLEETDWLVELAGEHRWIAGVIGWAPLAAPDIADHLDRMAGTAVIKGLRHVVQDEASGFLACSDFHRGVSMLKEWSLAYDLLIRPHQIHEAIAFVDRHPDQPFVLDHMAKPEIGRGDIKGWRSSMVELALRPRVFCKISGMVTESNWLDWTPDQLWPYFETALEAFGPGRLMVGSDWPVLTVACTYGRWWHVVTNWLDRLSENERRQIEGGVAAGVYGLQLPEGLNT